MSCTLPYLRVSTGQVRALFLHASSSLHANVSLHLLLPPTYSSSSPSSCPRHARGYVSSRVAPSVSPPSARDRDPHPDSLKDPPPSIRSIKSAVVSLPPPPSIQGDASPLSSQDSVSPSSEPFTEGSTSCLGFHQIPGPSPSFPLIGTNWIYFKFVGRYQLDKLHEAGLDKFHRYGPIVREEFEHRNPVVHLFDPKDFERVFRCQGKFPNRPPSEFVSQFRNQNPDLYPTVGIAHSQGETWFKERQTLAPVMLKMGLPENHSSTQDDICKDFTGFLKLKQEEEGLVSHLQEATDRLALESIVSFCLDYRLDILKNQVDSSNGQILINATKKLFDSYNKLYYGLPIWKIYSNSPYRQFTRAEGDIYQMAMDIMGKKAEESRCPMSLKDGASGDHAMTKKFNNVMSALMQNDKFDVRKIPITLIDFISGGTFAMSNTIATLLFHLATNPTVQQDLFNEVRSIVPSPQGNITVEDVARMPLLKACAKESFRLSSTIPAIVRILPQDTILSGYHVPAGTKVFSHFSVTCRSESFFPDPESFNPQRWMGRNRMNHHPFALLPFGFGNRMCIGRRFSELQLYLSVARTVNQFVMEPVTRTLDRTHAFIIIPSHPIAMKLHPRDE